MEPALMLFDTATRAFDPERGEVLDRMRRLAEDGTTVPAVTHETGFARRGRDRVVVIDGAVVVEEGPPRAVRGGPAHERSRRVLRAVAEH